MEVVDGSVRPGIHLALDALEGHRGFDFILILFGTSACCNEDVSGGVWKDKQTDMAGGFVVVVKWVLIPPVLQPRLEFLKDVFHILANRGDVATGVLSVLHGPVESILQRRFECAGFVPLEPRFFRLGDKVRFRQINKEEHAFDVVTASDIKRPHSRVRVDQHSFAVEHGAVQPPLLRGFVVYSSRGSCDVIPSDGQMFREIDNAAVS